MRRGARRALAGLGALAWLPAAAGAAEPARADAGSAGPDEVLARLGDRTITRGDVAQDIAFRIYRLQVDIHSLLKQETQRLVQQELLAREAERRGTTPEALLEEVTSDVEPVTEADVDRWLAEHPAEGSGPPEVVRPRIRHFLQERRRIQERLDLMRELRDRADYAWLLEPPEPPRVRVDVAGAPARGPEDAPVTIVHFASFAGAASARSARHLERLRRELGDRLRFVHRSFLRARDEAGLRAAELSALAAQRGRFWDFHDAAFDREGPLDAARLRAASRAAGLSEDARSAADAQAMLASVKADQEAGRRAGVPREPTLFVNGRYVSGLVGYDELRALVEEELQRAAPPRGVAQSDTD